VRNEHPSHEWGPHEDGIRWVQCQNCKALLHDHVATLKCDPTGWLLAHERAVNEVMFWRVMLKVAQAEAGATIPATGSWGLWQVA
jgi:hypothetical protein